MHVITFWAKFTASAPKKKTFYSPFPPPGYGPAWSPPASSSLSTPTGTGSSSVWSVLSFQTHLTFTRSWLRQSALRSTCGHALQNTSTIGAVLHTAVRAP